MYFWTDGLWTTRLDASLKSHVSEDPLAIDMVNGPKHCWNSDDRTIPIFIDLSEGRLGWKSLSVWYAKS